MRLLLRSPNADSIEIVFSTSSLFRPAYIYPAEPRKEPNFSYRLLRAIYPAFQLLFTNQVIRADDLARAMVDVAVQGTDRGGVFSRTMTSEPW